MSSTFPEAAPRLSASRRYFAACACRSAGRLGYGPPNTDTVNTDLLRAFGKRMDLDGVDRVSKTDAPDCDHKLLRSLSESRRHCLHFCSPVKGILIFQNPCQKTKVMNFEEWKLSKADFFVASTDL